MTNEGVSLEESAADTSGVEARMKSETGIEAAFQDSILMEILSFKK